MLKKHTKHTRHTKLQLDYHYKTADLKKSKGELKELIRKESGLPEGPGILIPGLPAWSTSASDASCWCLRICTVESGKSSAVGG